MISVDTVILGIGLTLALSIIAFAFGYGILTQKVKGNRYDIEVIHKEFKDYKIDNKQDHILITSKLDSLIKGR